MKLDLQRCVLHTFRIFVIQTLLFKVNLKQKRKHWDSVFCLGQSCRVDLQSGIKLSSLVENFKKFIIEKGGLGLEVQLVKIWHDLVYQCDARTKTGSSAFNRWWQYCDQNPSISISVYQMTILYLWPEPVHKRDNSWFMSSCLALSLPVSDNLIMQLSSLNIQRNSWEILHLEKRINVIGRLINETVIKCSP